MNRSQPFRTVKRKGQLPLELRAEQRDDGAWDASVRTKEWHPDYGDISVGRFWGIAATEVRAQQLAVDATATIARRDQEWQAAYDGTRP